MNNECGIVRDLLPLYIDGIASEASREFAEEHLRACADCRNEYERELSSRLDDACHKVDPGDGDRGFGRFMHTWNRRLKLLRGAVSLFAALLALVAYLGIVTGKGGGVLDLGNIVRGILGGVSFICAAVSALAWPSGAASAKSVKIVTIVVAAFVIILTVIVAGTSNAAVEVVG